MSTTTETVRPARADRTPRYGVMAAPLGTTIQVGRLNSAGDRFVHNDPDCTQMVIGAVIDWTQRHYDGAVSIDLGGKHVEIVVTDAPEPEAPASAEVSVLEQGAAA